VVAGDTLAQMKPAPDPLLHACGVLDADVARCVVVGDSTVDVAAARATRMPVVIAGAAGAAHSGADPVTVDQTRKRATRLRW
jgi:phosphoglycolate phosphatase